MRGLNRQWWRILALWLVVSAPIVVLIYQFVEPTYEAVSLLLIEPAQQDLFSAIHTAGMLENPNATTTYLETQVGLIKSTKVLNPAIADPLVVDLPTIKKSEDPKSDLLEKLKVEIVPKTTMISVSLELPDPAEAINIVQAVVQSYLKHNTDYSRSNNRDLTESLKQQIVKIGKEIELKRSLLKELNKKGHVVVLKSAEERLNTNLNTTSDANTAQPTFKTITEDHAQTMMAQMIQTDLQIIEMESMLQVKRDAYKAVQETSREPAQQVDGQQLARIEEEFGKDPDVLALKQEIDDTSEHLERIVRQRAAAPRSGAACGPDSIR